MNQGSSNHRLLGFITRDAGISHSEWHGFTQSVEWLQKQPSGTGVNPFTRRPIEYKTNNYYIVRNGERLGLVVWEEAECIGVYGNEEILSPYIKLLCELLRGEYETVES